ncbi:MAG TPA: condensation domain-containing protein, partial [Candidatus Kapabacteria bacterium]|nr:condensation domain-containing protein [Candidatus Kapabacteria bacterium]
MEKIDSHRIETILSLTPLQEGILFHYLQDPQSRVYFEQLSLEISGDINKSNFEKAWNMVIKTNEMLRTLFRWEKIEKPTQVILKEHPCALRFHVLPDMDNDRKEAALKEIKSKDRSEGFDLTQVPFRVTLCRLAEKKYEMIISSHHILYDGWSNGIILKEFFNAYHALCHGKRSIKPPVKSSFKDFIKWLQSRDRNTQEQYWKNYLADFETPTALPIKGRPERTTSPEEYSLILADDCKSKLENLGKNNRFTLAPIFYTAWGILLQKYCGSRDVIFGTTVSGRSAGIKGIENMVGLFINTVPLRVPLLPDFKLIDLIAHVEKELQIRKEFE